MDLSMVSEASFLGTDGVKISKSEMNPNSYVIGLVKEMIVRIDRIQEILRGFSPEDSKRQPIIDHEKTKSTEMSLGNFVEQVAGQKQEVSMVMNPETPLGNFVEQVAGQKQEISMVNPSTENPKMELCDDNFELLKQTQDRFELVNARIQNTNRFSYTLLIRKNLGVRKIPVKRRYHRARKKKSGGNCFVFQTKYTPRRDLVQALKSYGMFRSSSIRDRLVNRKAERAHLKGKKSIVMRRIQRVRKGSMDGTKYVKTGRQVSLSFAFNGKIGSGFRPQDPFNPFNDDDLMDSNKLATAARVLEQENLYTEHDGEKRGEASHGGQNMGYVRYSSRRHGSKEKQLIVLSMAEKVLMKGRVSNFSLVNQGWEPGGISAVIVHWDWVDAFYSGDRSLKLMQRIHKTRVREISQKFYYVVKRSTQIAGILSYFLVNITSENHKLLTMFEGLERQQIVIVKELRFGSEKEICTHAYWVENNNIKGRGSKLSEGTLMTFQYLELRTKGEQFVKSVAAPSKKVVGKRPRDPGRFSRRNRNGIQSEKNEVEVLMQSKYTIGELKLALYCIWKLGLLIHLEDKVGFLGASKCIGREWVSDTDKKHSMDEKVDQMGMYSFSRGVGIIVIWALERLGLLHSDVHRQLTSLNLQKLLWLKESGKWNSYFKGYLLLKLSVAEFVEGKHQRETSVVILNMENRHGGSMLEFLKRNKARSGNLKGDDVVKFTMEHPKSHLGSFFTNEEFHSPRPPELFSHSMSCFQVKEWLLLAGEFSLLLEKLINSRLLHVKGISFLTVLGAVQELLRFCAGLMGVLVHSMFQFPRPPERRWNKVVSRNFDVNVVEKRMAALIPCQLEDKNGYLRLCGLAMNLQLEDKLVFSRGEY